MIRAVIFDFDGTIVDSYEAHLESFKRALSKFGLTVEDTEIYRRFGKPAKQILSEILPKESQTRIKEMVKEKRIQFLETPKELRVFDDVKEILRFLKESRICIGLATSADRPSVSNVLSRFNLADYFDVIVSAEDVEEAKPNPDIFICAAKRLAIDVQECLVVGDSIFDVIAAKAACMKIVVLANNPFQIDEIRSQRVPIISEIIEVKKFL